MLFPAAHKCQGAPALSCIPLLCVQGTRDCWNQGEGSTSLGLCTNRILKGLELLHWSWSIWCWNFGAVFPVKHPLKGDELELEGEFYGFMAALRSPPHSYKSWHQWDIPGRAGGTNQERMGIFLGNETWSQGLLCQCLTGNV